MHTSTIVECPRCKARFAGVHLCGLYAGKGVSEPCYLEAAIFPERCKTRGCRSAPADWLLGEATYDQVWTGDERVLERIDERLARGLAPFDSGDGAS